MTTQAPPTYTEKAEQSLPGYDHPWYGHYPCVCSQSKGCDIHNPFQTPVYHNDRLVTPAKSKSTISRLRQKLLPSKYRKEESTSTKDDSEPDNKLSQPLEFFSADLPLDIYAAEAIPPLHPCIPYHLSFYHLHCAHRSLQGAARGALVEQLSCSGASSPSDPGAQYEWCSQVYYKEKKFFQYQDLDFTITRQRPITTMNIFFCHHRSHSVGPVEFYEHKGFEHAKCGRLPAEGSFVPLVPYSWKSSDGGYYRTESCNQCLTDNAISLQLYGDHVCLRLQVFRALGSGEGRPTNPWNSVWTALVTGKGEPRRTHYRDLEDVQDIVTKVGKAFDGCCIPDLTTRSYHA